VRVAAGVQVQVGSSYARIEHGAVADPASLKAELKIAETKIKGRQVGSTGGSGHAQRSYSGTVSRIDPGGA